MYLELVRSGQLVGQDLLPEAGDGIARLANLLHLLKNIFLVPTSYI